MRGKNVSWFDTTSFSGSLLLTSRGGQRRLGNQGRQSVLSALEYLDNLSSALEQGIVPYKAVKRVSARHSAQLFITHEGLSSGVLACCGDDGTFANATNTCKNWAKLFGPSLARSVLLPAANCRMSSNEILAASSCWIVA